MGNAFVQVLADSCATHAAANPDQLSERRLLAQMWPDGDEVLISKLVSVFQDLRVGHQDGAIAYPFSLRCVTVTRCLDHGASRLVADSRAQRIDQPRQASARVPHRLAAVGAALHHRCALVLGST